MSIRVMTWVWDNSPHKGSALLLLLAIADMANDDGVSWPGLARLAKKTRLGRRYVIELIEELEKSGSIEVKRRKDGDLNLSNIYRVVCGASLVNEETLGSEPQTTTPSEPQTTTVVNHGSPESSIKHHKETSKNHDDIATVFLETWKALFPEKPQPKPATISAKLKTRLENTGFRDNWKAALERGAKTRVLHREGWFNATFFLRNDENYEKVLTGWMDWKDEEQYKGNGKSGATKITPAPAQQDSGKGIYV